MSPNYSSVVDISDKIIYSNVQAIQYVFENNFDKLKELTLIQLEEQDENGRTACHAACFKGYPDMLNYMIEKFGDDAKRFCDIKDNNGQTAVHYACGIEWD